MSTYPPSAPITATPSGPAVHSLLAHPALVTRRLAELLDRKMLADYILSGRIAATGGVVLFEQGWPTMDGEVESVAPGGEFPTATIERSLASAKTEKWAAATEITDESIARLSITPVDAGLQVLAHAVAKRTDLSAMAAIVEATIANTFDVTGAGNGGAWSSSANIVTSALKAKAVAEAADNGVAFDTIVLSPTAYAQAVSLLIAGGVFPREADGNPLTTGQFPQFAGLTWTSSPRATADPLLIDRKRFGALAFEDLGGPYNRNATTGLETQVIRLAERDAYRVQARRVVAPVVLDPAAALWLTETGLS